MRGVWVLTVTTHIFVLIIKGSHSEFVRTPGVKYVQSGQHASFTWEFDVNLVDAIIDIKLIEASGDILSWSDGDWTIKDQRYIPLKNGTSVGFTLQEVTDSDGGHTFQCNVFQDNKSYHNEDATIVIDRPPKIITVTQSPDDVFEGRDILLTCSAQGNSIPPEMSRDIVYSWYIGDKVVSPDNRHSFLLSGKQSKLLIKDLRTTDGPYICRAQELHSKMYSEESHHLDVKTTVSPYSKASSTPHVSDVPMGPVTDADKTPYESDTTVPLPTGAPVTESGLRHFLKYGAGPLAVAVVLLVLVVILAKFASVIKSKKKRNIKEKTALIHPESTNHETEPGSPVRSSDTITFTKDDGGHPGKRTSYAEIDEVYTEIPDDKIMSRKSLEVIKSKAPNVPRSRPAIPSSSPLPSSPLPGIPSMTDMAEDADPYLKPSDHSIIDQEPVLLYHNLSSSSLQNGKNLELPVVTEQYLTTGGQTQNMDDAYIPMDGKDAGGDAKIRPRLDSNTTPKHTDISHEKMAVPNVYNKTPTLKSAPSDGPPTRSVPSEYLQLVGN